MEPVTEASISVRQQPKTSFGKDGITIDGVPVILLCSSVFYFRIPSGLWKDRLRKVKEAGYNAIDVYFPWNYHEMELGEWDFSGERDAGRFLKEAAEAGLWVVARPGPYICSEWDGGALPAYLLTEPGIRLRDNDPLFLEATGRWFSRIMPLLREHELGKAGSVIAVQLENELDFFDCRDPHGYMSALRDMALCHGIEAPLFACAGQGDLFGAAGDAEGVMPTCNFYPGDKDPAFEEKVIAYFRELQQRDYPLCVTETNRSHFLLRRLLGAGAKLLSPYLQTSGTNFGFTNAINNWGKPLAFLASDYDFHGMITPAGERREEFYEGRLLGGLIRALETRLARAVPVPNVVNVESGLPDCAGLRYSLELDGGGYLLSLPNVGKRDEDVTLRNGDAFIPQYTRLTVAADRCPLLLYDVPLQGWGMDGKIRYATAELAAAERMDRGIALVFYTDAASDAELAFDIPAVDIITALGADVRQQDSGGFVIVARGTEGRVELACRDGLLLRIYVVDRRRASRLKGISAAGELIDGNLHANDAAVEKNPGAAVSINWQKALLPDGGASQPISYKKLGDKPMRLEEAGIYRGMAWYRATGKTAASGKPAIGILLQEAADVASVYCDGQFTGTAVPGGGSAFLPLGKETSDIGEIVIRSEIWGHANFDDSALPGLRLDAMKGLKQAIMVTGLADMSANWAYSPCEPEEAETFLQANGRPTRWAITNWGGWMTSRLLEAGVYCKDFRASKEADSWVLQFPGISFLARVYVNGHSAGGVHPGDPYVDITPYVSPGEENQVVLYLERYYHQQAGKITLYEGNGATGWRVGGCGERRLWDVSGDVLPESVSCELPLPLAAGEVIWLTAELPADVRPACRRMICEGTKVKMTVFFNGRLVGRLWLPGGSSRPHMTGGAQELVYLPEPWYETGSESNRLALLVEAVEAGAELSGFHLRDIDTDSDPLSM